MQICCLKDLKGDIKQILHGISKDLLSTLQYAQLAEGLISITFPPKGSSSKVQSMLSWRVSQSADPASGRLSDCKGKLDATKTVTNYLHGLKRNFRHHPLKIFCTPKKETQHHGAT